MAILDQYP